MFYKGYKILTRKSNLGGKGTRNIVILYHGKSTIISVKIFWNLFCLFHYWRGSKFFLKKKKKHKKFLRTSLVETCLGHKLTNKLPNRVIIVMYYL